MLILNCFKELYMNKNEIVTIRKNLDKQVGQLELALFNIDIANQPYLPEHIKNILNNELNRLRDIQDEIRNSMIKLSEHQNRLVDQEENEESLTM